MFRVSPEAVATAATFNARSKQARPQPSQSDGFSALVDSNAPDSQRDTTPSADKPQRLDGSDTPPKADSRPETHTDNQPDGKSKQTLDASKSDASSDSKPNTGTGVKTNSKTDAKNDGKSDAKASAKADAKAGKDGADTATADATSLTGEAAATANAGKVEIAVDATAVVAPGDAAKAIAAKLSADDKTKDANATDAATPVVPVVLTDAAAIVAVAIPVAAATDAQATTPAPKTDTQIAGIEVASNPSAAALATGTASAAATAETKAAANSNTPATPAIPAVSSANSPAVATDAVATGTDTTVAASADDAAKTAASKTLVQPLAASHVVSPDAEVAAAESTAIPPVSPAKPKAVSVSENTDKTTPNDTDTKTDSPSAPSLPEQTAEAKAPRGAEHAKGDNDKTAAPADTFEAAPSDTKQANAQTAAAPAPAEHHAPAVARAVPADLNLQPVQTQQTLPLQAQTQNLIVTPAVQINTTLANTPVPVSGLAVDIALRAAGGSSRFEIRLDPAELGRIDVRLDVDKHGNVTSHLTVEKPATLDMLRRDAPQLQQALEDAGLKTGDGGLQFSLRDQSSGRNDDNGSGRNSQRLIISEDDTVPAQVAGRTYGRALGSSSGVDISV